MTGLSQAKAAKFLKDVAGIGQTKLSYWIRTGVLQGVPGGGASGVRCYLQPHHIMQALTVADLRNQGASMQKIRRAVDKLAERRSMEDWHEQWLFVDCNGDIGSYDEAADVLQRVRDGQGYVVDVAGFREKMRQLQGRMVQQDMLSEEHVDHERETVTS